MFFMDSPLHDNQRPTMLYRIKIFISRTPLLFGHILLLFTLRLVIDDE